MEARGGISNNKQNKFLTCLKGGRYYLNEPDRIQISEVKKCLLYSGAFKAIRGNTSLN